MSRTQPADNGPAGHLVKGVGFIIGLATELHANNKAKKLGSQSTKERSRQTDVLQDQTCEEANGDPPAYDEAMASRTSLDSQTSKTDTVSTYVDKPFTLQPLPYPVILPQRRPNSKARGFARAYAPDLRKYKGIDDTMFLGFLKDFHKSSQASAIFQVINIAAFAAGFAPSAIAMAVSMSVQAASRGAMELQSRRRTNSYLDKANKELFHPRNLHCMIMTFKPEARENAFLNLHYESGSMTEAPASLSRLTSDASSAHGKIGGMFRTSDGVTEGELAIPQAAHLVYPTPTPSETSRSRSDGIRNGTPYGRKDRDSTWKSTGKFISEYKDRRAQSKFAAKHGHDSKLAVPGASDPGKFASRFSDPNHPINSGSPLALLTGGKVGSSDDIKGILMGAQYRTRPRHQMQSTASDTICRESETKTGLLDGVRKMMQQDVLYLLVAEIPSEDEMKVLTGVM
jgi:hypothetical protein